MKRRLLLGLSAVLLLAILASTALVILASTDETWQQRLEVVPLRARAYLRQLGPEPVLPTPPPARDDSRARLLYATPEPTPTLAAPAVSVVEEGSASPVPPTVTAPAATALPSPSPTAEPEPTAVPLAPVAAQITLSGVQHAYQLWNNCGPVTVAMNLSYYDLNRDQREAARFLKPDQDDKNVSPEELVAYARSQGFDGIVRMGGTIELLQRLLTGGFPVIVEDWMEPEDRGGIGHYRLFTGYDAGAGYFLAQDSYYGPNREMPVQGFDANWRVFNRKYVVIYPPEDAGKVHDILGEMSDDEQMLQHALDVAREEAQRDPEDVFAWFNLGTTYTHLGEHLLAAEAFDEARRIGLPFRMLWYQMEPFRAYLEAGRYEDVIQLADATAQSTGGHEEAYYYQALAYEAQGREQEALTYLERALDYNPNYQPAADLLAILRG
jgi:tetratricopeptide (TPR) repeat protein